MRSIKLGFIIIFYFSVGRIRSSRVRLGTGRRRRSTANVALANL